MYYRVINVNFARGYYSFGPYYGRTCLLVCQMPLTFLGNYRFLLLVFLFFVIIDTLSNTEYLPVRNCDSMWGY